MKMARLKNIWVCIAIMAFLACIANAHVEDSGIPQGIRQSSLHIKGYDFTLLSSKSHLAVNKENQFSMQIKDENGNIIRNSDVQGQILDSGFGKEIFYAAVIEEDGIYSFKWKPSFAGSYVVQYIIRDKEGVVLQPSFAIEVIDKKGVYSLYGSIAAAVAILAIGTYIALPRQKRHFRIAPIIYSLLIAGATVALGYSVSYYYGAGGEKGFVVCGDDGCDLAVHYHSQLEMGICGEEYNLPLEAGDLGKQHTHKEKDKLHFHALIKTDKSGTEILEPEKLRLGGLFEQLNIPFTKDCFADKCSGDLCNGRNGKLTVEVNGVPNEGASDYSWRDGDEIKIYFE
jgi:hypothetical protein